jgi:uncharacterized membrane protein YdjX (TVP38/TMEM64 family)
MSGLSKTSCIVAGVVLIGAGIATVLAMEGSAMSPDQMSDYVLSYGAWAPLAVVALMILHSVVPFPAELLAICAGAIFGIVMGAALIWTGAMLGAALTFAVARWIGRDAVEAWLPDHQIETLRRWSDDNGAAALLIGRFIPLIAFNLINLAAAMTRVRFATFLWTTAVGILPATVLCTYLGAHMRELDWPMLAIVSAAGLFIVLSLHVLLKRRKRL